MKVIISVDHRVSDGAEGASFMQKLPTLPGTVRQGVQVKTPGLRGRVFGTAC